MNGVCSMYGERMGTYRLSVGEPEGRKTLGMS
jgi:hypothetical protein